MVELSRMAIDTFLPDVKKIYASLEVQLANYEGMNEKPRLRMGYLENEMGLAKMMHATHLMNAWLKGKPFKLNPFIYEKTDEKARWTDMMEIIATKIAEHDNEKPVITISLSKSGRISREVNGSLLVHDFEGDGLRLELLKLLPQDGNYMPTKTIMSILGSKSTGAINKLVEAINSAAQQKLQLPINKNLIESKRRSGYRINPIYNLVIEK